MQWRKMALCVLAASMTLTACGESDGGSSAKDGLKVGVVQIVSHPALDATREGFIEGLKETGYEEGKNLTIDVQNANGDQSTLTNIANAFATSDDDLFYAIATPSAQALAQTIMQKPIVFAAVTDPVAAELVDSWEKPGANVTGMSDLNPMDAQIELIQEVLPDVKRMGIVYSSGEVNSEVQVKAAQEAASAAGIELVTKTVTNSSEVQQAAQSLDVDAFLIPTDNVVVAAAESVVQVAEQQHIPVFASDEATMERGAAAGLSVNYTQQGKDAAALAVKIIDGADPGTLAVETQKEFDLFVNQKAAAAQGVNLPKAVVDRAAKQF